MNDEKNDKLWKEIKAEFLEFVKDIYPADPLKAMQIDCYNPWIIGYLHDLRLNGTINKILTKIRSEQRLNCHVGLGDLHPVNLTWAKDFIRDTRQYLKIKPDDIDYLRWMKEYREQSPSFDLLVWLLENDFKVSMLESPEIKKWKEEAEQDNDLLAFIEDDLGFRTDEGLLFYEGIKRDIHNIRKINETRPDVIAIGSAHALIYDVLMDRDGKRTFYFPSNQRLIGNVGLEIIRNVHHIYDFYKTRYKK